MHLLGKKNIMPLVLYSAKEPSQYLLNQYLSSFGSIERFRRVVENEIASFKDWPGDIIASSEHLQSKLVDDDDLDHLFSSIHKHLCPTNIFIVLYVRNQHDLLLSIESEAIKAGKKSCSITSKPWQNPYYDNLFSHFITIKRWEKFVGRRNIIVKSYDFESIDNALINSFMRIIFSEECKKVFQLEERANTSMSMQALVVRSMINRRLIDHHGVNRAEMAKFQFINKLLSKHFGSEGGRLHIPLQTSMDIRNHYADQNEKTEAFAGEHLYKWPKKFTPYDGDKYSARFDISPDDISELIADIAVQLNKKKRP